MNKRFFYITKPVIILSLVSLFTDMASEMLYPIMPIYLKTIGFSVLLIGILEGFAETIAGLSKGYFGQLSDVKNKRLPFVQLGYALSAISKPLLAVFTFPIWIFFSRTIDRIGKGLRTAPRDAMLSFETTKENKAKVFGFHRSMDTLGAVFGPGIALLFLYIYPGEYKILFIIAFIPGVIAVISTFLLKDKKTIQSNLQKINFFSFTKYYKSANPEYRKLLKGLILFAAVNSSDVLLLLKMKENGIADQTIITVYIYYNLVFALFSFPAGILADKLGIKNTFITGLFLFAIVYTGFAFANSWYQYLILFSMYGLYASCTEGIAKAWVSNIVPQSETGTAIGTYAAYNSIAAFIASTTAGIIWYKAGAEYAFGFTAFVALLLIYYFQQLNSGRKM